ncbi:hypothetical protein FOZ61_003766 [Perkinsus olseni]|uniref:Uncharacterized protein n=1 Tax=Perkinsus olseni TaxID=32597 RepID=A0A7J6MTV6_PEROL|nr:hypothetical protein FOZ61_003766 [Perkinsus olseni]KAF4675019.1 hypothetical protein FOL46_003187 [Perkinsus olseni]
MKIQINFLNHSSAPESPNVTVEISGTVGLSFWFEEDVYVKWTMDAGDGIMYSHDDLGLTTFTLKAWVFAYLTGAAAGVAKSPVADLFSVQHVLVMRLGDAFFFTGNIRAQGAYLTTASIQQGFDKHERFLYAEIYD